ncbi:MAG: prolipoprotein diacylglyceryl transferase [Candidatus Omnitrophica bacterium]|nr:prolipoprotein diacylglyceryl transferase [Candidatus Omnitrophota bacterium]MCM8771077.1 prolipoprotein diacylglyceryl transferase [Candidatus Omnitrophota bacterium]
MHPVIFSIGPIHIYAYGLLLVLAFFIATVLATLQARQRGINPELIWNLAFILTISGIIGARILYVLENLNFYLKNPLEIIILQHGGLSWFGGLALASIFGIRYLRKKQLAIYGILDLLVPYLALAQSIGRIGCFLNGCCYGRESIWGVYFPVHNKVLLPTQIYSSLILLLIFIILRLLSSKSLPGGFIFYTYLILYSVKRFFIEFLRADNRPFIWGLSLFQIICLFLFIFSLIKLFSLRKTRP